MFLPPHTSTTFRHAVYIDSPARDFPVNDDLIHKIIICFYKKGVLGVKKRIAQYSLQANKISLTRIVQRICKNEKFVDEI